MPPKRAASETADTADTADTAGTDAGTDTHTGGALMPPPATPPSKRRRSSHAHGHSARTPSTSAPPSLFFDLPLPPPYNPSSPDAANESPSDTQFAAFLHSGISTLPAPTQSLYASAMRNLAPQNTPELTGEMRASLTSAVTGFVAHVPTTDWEGRFLTRLARGEVSGGELVLWADTVTAALRAFSAVGGSPAPSWPSSPASASAGSPVPPRSADPDTPARTRAATDAAPRRSNTSGRSATIRTSALTRDANACVLTSMVGPSLEVAHIIPFSVRGGKADAFWGFMSLFLGVRGAERLRWATLQLANGEDPAEQRHAGTAASAAAVGELANCMTLSATAHRHFDAGAIEMLPVPGSGDWSGDYDPSVVSSYEVRLSFPGQALTPFSRCVYSAGAPPQLLSITHLAPGDVITLATPDPAQWPLPHPLLLLLHALCGRVKRLRAAAGWPVLPYGDGSDYEVSWGEEEEEVEIWDEDEEEGIKACCGSEYDAVVGISACGARAEPETGPESGMGDRGRKRKFSAAVVEEKEGGWDGDDMLEWPRKVAVVMGEMGMREEERWRLMKRGGRRE